MSRKKDPKIKKNPASDRRKECELICERLLGWKRVRGLRDGGGRSIWLKPVDGVTALIEQVTPTFRTGNDMLMIINALISKGIVVSISDDGDVCSCDLSPDPTGRDISYCAADAPDAVRSAAHTWCIKAGEST